MIQSYQCCWAHAPIDSYPCRLSGYAPDPHKPLFPLTRADWIGYGFAAISLFIAAGGGIGGGGILVPLYILLLGVHQSIHRWRCCHADFHVTGVAGQTIAKLFPNTSCSSSTPQICRLTGLLTVPAERCSEDCCCARRLQH